MTRPLRQPAGLLAEAWRANLAQPLHTVTIGLVLAAAAAVVVATTGSTLVAERDVLAQVDAAGTRTIQLVDTGGAGLDASAVERIGRLDAVEWALGIGPVRDARNVALGEAGVPTPTRTIVGTLPPDLEVSAGHAIPGGGLVTPVANDTLGLDVPLGAVERADGTQVTLTGAARPTGVLGTLDGSVLVPADDPEVELARIVVLATSPAAVEGLGPILRELAAPADPRQLDVAIPDQLARIRAAIAGELGGFARQLLGLVVATGVVLTGIATYAFTALRRRELGRRRALGASRPQLIALVLTQAAITAVAGGLLGAIAGLVIAAGASLRFTLAVAIVIAVSGTIAAAPPAVLAARRDPVAVLRQP